MCNFSDRVATNFLTILNQFLPFTLFFELKNQNFQKMKKKKKNCLEILSFYIRAPKIMTISVTYPKDLWEYFFTREIKSRSPNGHNCEL